MDARYQLDNQIFLRIVSDPWSLDKAEMTFEVQEHKDYPDTKREYTTKKKSIRRLLEMARPGDLISIAQHDYASDVADEVEIPSLSTRALLNRIETLESQVKALLDGRLHLNDMR
jgi:hypothetical protein